MPMNSKGQFSRLLLIGWVALFALVLVGTIFLVTVTPEPKKPTSLSACGNQICELGETIGNCMQDCFVCNKNGQCENNLGENQNSCPNDCPPTLLPACNNNETCDSGENQQNCPNDCTQTVQPRCGNGTCETGETIASCPQDCGGCTSSAQCEDNNASTVNYCSLQTRLCEFRLGACSELGGLICSSGFVCAGNTIYSGNSPECCLGNCQQISSDLFATCENNVCDAGETVENCPWDCQPVPPADPIEKPNFSIVVASSGTFAQYFQDFHPGLPAATKTGNTWTWPNDAFLENISITYLGNDEWQLQFTPKADLSAVNFPWRLDPYAVNGPIADDTVFFTYLGGTFKKESLFMVNAWEGDLDYPGLNFAPFLIIADNQKAQIAAAINWPPKRVQVYHARQQTFIKYPDFFPVNQSVVLRTLLAEATGSSTAGYAPWQLVLRKYKKWLDERAPAPSYPIWLQQSEGFLNYDLMNRPAFNPTELQTVWNQWKDHFKWIQFWGQMSNYAGPPEWAVPPLLPGEQIGCCLQTSTMHNRYLNSIPSLPSIVQGITSAGYHAGYYSREPPPEAPYYGRLDNSDGAQYVRNWQTRNRDEYKANAQYIDVIARQYMGEPSAVLTRFSDGTIFEDAFLEGFVDVYPRASLLSGYIDGGDRPGGPGINPQTANEGTFINLVRLLMGNRIGILGVSNGDYVFYGWDANPPHWLERQIFLLGAKADITNPNRVFLDFGTANQYLLDIKAKRDAVQWWNRNPTYLDTIGLTEIPPGIDARRFKTSDNKDWIAIDNPNQLAGQLKIKGRIVNIPSDKLSIVEAS